MNVMTLLEDQSLIADKQILGLKDTLFSTFLFSLQYFNNYLFINELKIYHNKFKSNMLW